MSCSCCARAAHGSPANGSCLPVRGTTRFSSAPGRCTMTARSLPTSLSTPLNLGTVPRSPAAVSPGIPPLASLRRHHRHPDRGHPGHGRHLGPYRGAVLASARPPAGGQLLHDPQPPPPGRPLGRLPQLRYGDPAAVTDRDL